MLTVSGKVILFGEHAVVYGEPALASAIDRRVYVRVERTAGDAVEVESEALGSRTSFPVDDRQDPSPEEPFRYVRKAVHVAFEHAGDKTGLRISIDSELPVASGLGTSAAVSVATILAVGRLLGKDIDAGTLADLGHRVELEVQGAASPTDTAMAAFGGTRFIQPGEGFEALDASLPLVVGCTGIQRSTKALVDGVRRRREAYPEIVDPVLKAIGEITRKARDCLADGRDLGVLMDINHGLLEALGVGNEKLSELVHAARKAGAGGAKLTGAGGGGCMIAYAPGSQDAVAEAIRACGCRVLKTSGGSEGARVEP
ncbi:MAG: mevalonate kinase [Euryarchaeota archaeon]|nr:mevalonate kinase [Euryarchaeota archaeon]